MTGKQIIIDVTQCPYYKEDRTCTYLSYKSKCEGDCNWTTYKEMEEQLKHKEQECEKLKLDLIEAKAHGDYLNNLALSKTLDTVSNKLDQLKAENDELKKQFKLAEPLYQACNIKDKKINKLKQTLAKIKEIAENNKHSVLCFTVFESDAIKVNNEPMAVILQKINECEVDK